MHYPSGWRLETTYKSLWAKKRGAYIEYYDNLQITESNLFNVSMAILVLCIAAGLALSFWTITVTRKRLAALSTSANKICRGDLQAASAPKLIRDEIDELSMCLSQMTERLIGVVAIDKLLEGAEEERKRIAMDMHDQVLSNLTTLTRQVDSLRLKQLPPDELSREYERLLSNIDETGNDIRRILDDLHPRTLDHLGLEAAIRSFLEKNVVDSDSLSYYLNVDCGIDQYLSDYQRLSMYRIIQEAVHNIIRHARCNKLEISLRHKNNRIMLLIEDNGIGMTVDTELLNRGRGLTHIKERARSIGASVNWLPSRFSSGVKLELRMPISSS